MTSLGGFDISGASGIAYLVAVVNGSSQSTLWTVNLATGAAAFVNLTANSSAIGGGSRLAVISVQPIALPIPEPSTALLLGLGLAALARKRRTLLQTAISQRKQQQVVQHALEALSTEYRQALVLANLQGISHSEIADRVGEPVGTIKSRIRRAMEELRTDLSSGILGSRGGGGC